MKEYTIGYGAGAVQMMDARRAEDWAAHLLPHLRPGLRLLDCGCGPGSITLGLAARVAPGEVIGIDREASQIEQARRVAAACGAENVRFETGNVTALPFDDAELDVVHAHMVLMHLGEPGVAVREFLRVLRPGGFVALRDAVIDAFWLRGPEADLRAAAFPLLQAVTRGRGGDWNRGRVTGDLLREAGFVRILPSASYNSSGQGFENPSMGVGFAGMLTEIRDSIVTAGHATAERVDDVISAWRRFGEHPSDFFASAAGEVIGWKADD